MSIVNVAYHFLQIPLVKTSIHNINSLRIIYYHKVSNLNENYYFGNEINFETFKRQIFYFKKHYKIIPLSKAIQKALNKESLKNHLVITFDDGFRDIYEYIYPFLKKLKLSATYFLIDNMIDNKDLMWRNKLIVIENAINTQTKQKLIHILEEILSTKLDSSLSLLTLSNSWKMSQKDELANILWKEANIGSLEEYLEKNKPYLTKKQIFEMLENNQEIGSHSKSHPFCNKLSKKEIEKEIINSIKNLSQMFNVKIKSFSYPFGARVSKELEEYIIQKTEIKTLLGIKDNFTNHSNPITWERIDMEYSYKESIAYFYLFPFYNKIKPFLKR